jgi:hypothetical protein
MELKEKIKETWVVIIAALILGPCFIYPGKTSDIPMFSIFFFIIIGANVLTKKYLAYFFEAEVKTKFWSIYRYWFKEGGHFKRPVYMLWFPVFLTIFTMGSIKWMPIIEFEIKPKIERAARRHEGMYRFVEMTEWHIALIAMWGIIANLLLAIIGYLLGGSIPGGETFSKLNIYFALWSLLPISGLDGAKMFFGSRPLWFSFVIIVLLFFLFSVRVFI